MHVCVLTRTHINRAGRNQRLLISVPQKRAPIEVFYNVHQALKPSFRPQEHRRPRFSFFHSSQCQRADLNAVTGETSLEAVLPNSFGETRSISGCPADRLPCQRTLNSGSECRSASSALAGYIRDVSVCQHPFSFFVFDPSKVFSKRSMKLLKLKLLCYFRGLLRSLASYRRRGLQRWAGYRGQVLACKPPAFVKTTFSENRSSAPVDNSTE